MFKERDSIVGPRRTAQRLLLAGVLAFGIPSSLAACRSTNAEPTRTPNAPTTIRNLCDYYGEKELTLQIGVNKGAIVQGVDNSKQRIIPIRQAYNPDGLMIGFVALKDDGSPYENPPAIIPGEYRVHPPTEGPFGPEQKQTVTLTGEVTHLKEPAQNSCVFKAK